MKVDSVFLNGLRPLQPPSWAVSSGEGARPAGEKDFSDYLQDALRQVDGLQKEAQRSALDVATGQESDVHKTMVAYEKAMLALQLTIEIRNKIVEAYQEIMRIQM